LAYETRTSLVDLLLHPRSVAIIGASTNPEALGGRPVGFLANYGYAGAVYPVNPNSEIVQGVRAYPSILDVPEAVDLAMIVVRAELVPATLRDCVTAGVGAVVLVSSGFGEGGVLDTGVLESAREAIRGSGIRVLGPNCEGLASLRDSAPVTFSPVLDVHRGGGRLREGEISVIGQSGGLTFAVAQWGSEVGLGFNALITVGNEIDVDELELAEALLDDPGTSVLVLLMEGVSDLERFAEVANAYRRAGKTIVAAKMGRSTAGARAALFHTLHDTGDDAAYSRVFEEAGVLQANGMEELTDILQAVTKARAANGRRVGIITTSGGTGVWLADACSDAGLEVPVLSAATRTTLAEHMPAYGSPSNPVDLTAQFVAGGSFVPPLRDLAASGEVDMIILATSLSNKGRLDADREKLAELIPASPVPIALLSYTKPAPTAVELLNGLDVPWYTDAVRAARGLLAMRRDQASER
jgi:acyl-CoA synthetase (NDP forming)